MNIGILLYAKFPLKVNSAFHLHLKSSPKSNNQKPKPLTDRGTMHGGRRSCGILTRIAATYAIAYDKKWVWVGSGLAICYNSGCLLMILRNAMVTK